MKPLPLVILAAFLSLSAGNTPQQEYIDRYSGIARSEMRRKGIPASITLAQGLLESDAGRSPLAVKGNNHFGIKCHSDWKGPGMKHDDDAPKECFRVYKNAEDSFRDHSEFLSGSQRYKSLFKLSATDYKAWANGLKAAGYATDPKYPSKLIGIIEEYGLAKYDKTLKKESQRASGPEPSRAQVPESGVREPEPVKASSECENYEFSVSRRMQNEDGVAFIVSVDGDTYRSIAKAEGLFLKELLKFNGLSKEVPLEPWTVVYLEKRKAK